MALFGKKKKENKSERQTTLSQNETSYFGKKLLIKGRVSGNGHIIILGGLNGEFDVKGRIKIAQPAKIQGEVKADVISVNGSVQGSLVAQERLHLDKTARIEGRITTSKLSISEGASFDGEIAMKGESAKPPRQDADASAGINQNAATSTQK